MQQAGEYAQPLARNTQVRVPVVAGLVTSRLRSANALFSGTTYSDAKTQVLVKNTGNTQVTVQFQQTDDYVNGPFTLLGGGITVNPLAQASADIYPSQRFVELKGLTGTGTVNVSLSSQVQYDELAFDRTDGRAPSSLWQASLPGWSTL